MKLKYTVSCTKDKMWYAHMIGFPNIPCMIQERHTFSESKKYALENAAIMSLLPYQDYMNLRREALETGTIRGYEPTNHWK